VIKYFLWLILICLTPLWGQEFAKGITVDLREPEYCEGVLHTTKGGVISGPDMRLQALDIKYTRKVVEGQPVHTIEAEGELLLEFGEYIFVGEALEFDLQTHTGRLYNGRTALEPWFFGGEIIDLLADGNYFVEGAYLTTSENVDQDWQIRAGSALLIDKQFVDAKNVQFRFQGIPLFWLPKFKADLDSIFNSPIRYSVRWGGRRTRVGLKYEFFSWRRFKAFWILDYSLKRGLGTGLETYYSSPDHKETLETVNYFGKMPSIVHPNDKVRYRIQGVYSNLLLEDSVSVDLTWDKLSDLDMPSDYSDRGLEINNAMRTQLHVRRQDPNWITNFTTRVRVNGFQTVKQELPTLQGRWRPKEIGRTGIIANTQLVTSYLDFKYSNGLMHVHDYHSSRVGLVHNYLRPFHLGAATWTPTAGLVAINYSNSPHRGGDRWVVVGQFCSDLNTRIHRYYGDCKHVWIPYAKYSYYTFPTTGPHHHYIFDIDDGWYRLNMLRLGAQQNFYMKDANGVIHRILMADVWTQAFFDTPTLPYTFTNLYCNLVFNTSLRLRHVIQSAWDLHRHRIAYVNFRTEWTLSSDFAMSFEYRHRYPFDWRKVDHTNFILESFHSNEALLHSELSDRRDTLLLHAYYRLNPDWAIEFECREGWRRKHQPAYTEWEIDLLGLLFSACHVKFSYCRLVDGARYGVTFSLGLNRPETLGGAPVIPCLEY